MTMISKTSPPPPAACPLSESFAIQCRVVWALILREMLTRFGRHNIGFAWMFVEPMMFTVGVTTIWTLAGMHKGSSIPIAAFALTGYSCILLWRNMPGRAESAVKMNIPLLYHRNVRILDLFLARLILEGGGATMSFMILGVIFTWIGWIAPPENILLVIIGWFAMAFFGISFAMFVGAWATKWHWVEKIWHPAAYLMVPLSGAMFLVDSLPKKAQEFMLYVPMVHGCECIRDGYFGSQFRAHYSLAYVTLFSLILLIVALIVMKNARDNLEHH